MIRMTLTSACVALGLVALAPNAAVSASSTKCSDSGLVAAKTSGGTTSTARITNLHASGVSCSKARGVAKQIAALELSNKLGKSVAGYRLTYTRPCASCSPQFNLTAKRSGATLKMRVNPGG